MDKEKVSIIVPMYNAEKFIGKTIESVLSQTYENWEMLIMNDVSTDNSLAVVNEYVKKDDRIKVVNTEKNMGVVKGRNHLIDLANGKYIAFLDADDYWHSQKLEKQIKFMKEKSEISYTDMLKNNYLGCLTVMYDVEKVGKRYFKELEKNEDYVLWLEIVKDVKTIFGLKENLAYYRVLDNSRSSNKAKTAKVRWEIYRKVEKLPFLKSVYYFLHYAVRAVLKSK